MSSVPSQGRHLLEAGALVPAWRESYWAEDVAVDEKEKCCLADLSVPGAAVKSMGCRVGHI